MELDFSKKFMFISKTEEANQEEIDKMMRLILRETVCMNDHSLKPNKQIRQIFKQHLE